MPLSHGEPSRRAAPASVALPSSSASTSNITFSSSRDRLAPGQKWATLVDVLADLFVRIDSTPGPPVQLTAAATGTA